jgi:hypothetical protein
MIQFGLRNGLADAKTVFQSLFDTGENNLVPTGQLFF